MHILSGVLLLIAVLLLAWVVYRYVRYDKQAFSRHHLSQSLTTLGVLALLLIVVIAFCVMMLSNMT